MSGPRVILVSDALTLIVLAQQHPEGMIIARVSSALRDTFKTSARIGAVSCPKHYLEKPDIALGNPRHWYFAPTRADYEACFSDVAPRPCQRCWRDKYGSFYDPP